MPISGLVLTLVEEPHARQGALEILRRHPAIEVGEPADVRVPIVVETTDAEEDRLVWEWLHAIPGVSFVVVAFIHFDEGDAECGSSSSFAGCVSDALPLAGSDVK
jgi:hypothetical protein